MAPTLREKMRRVVDCTDTRAGRSFDIAVQALVVVSVVSFSVETLPGLAEEARRALRVLEAAIVLLFTVEYLVRLYAAESRRKYATSFFGAIDLVAIVPFYIAMGVDLRSLKVFRMLRLFRLLKLTRYNSAMQRLARAFHSVREEMVLFAVVTAKLMFLASVGIYYFEHEAQPEAFKSVFHSFWWSMVTLTTVGYGDIVPVTTGGRAFTFVLLMIGLAIVALPAGLLASALAERKQAEEGALGRDPAGPVGGGPDGGSGYSSSSTANMQKGSSPPRDK